MHTVKVTFFCLLANCRNYKNVCTQLGKFPGTIPITTHTLEPSHEEEPLTEMKDDINNLISRAKRLSTLPSSGKMLSNTLNILSAYANIGALANTFRESGALDLLLTLLATKDSTAHKSAGNMLRSLTTFDLSSRAYVLLHLSKIDSSQLTSVQGRQMLLDLFSETASSGESEALLRGITLPQVGVVNIHDDVCTYLAHDCNTPSCCVQHSI